MWKVFSHWNTGNSYTETKCISVWSCEDGKMLNLCMLIFHIFKLLIEVTSGRPQKRALLVFHWIYLKPESSKYKTLKNILTIVSPGCIPARIASIWVWVNWIVLLEQSKTRSENGQILPSFDKSNCFNKSELKYLATCFSRITCLQTFYINETIIATIFFTHMTILQFLNKTVDHIVHMTTKSFHLKDCVFSYYLLRML